jgi:hypothetical protein
MTSSTESKVSSPTAAPSSAAGTTQSPLTDEMLARFSARAAAYD